MQILLLLTGLEEIIICSIAVSPSLVSLDISTKFIVMTVDICWSSDKAQVKLKFVLFFACVLHGGSPVLSVFYSTKQHAKTRQQPNSTQTSTNLPLPPLPPHLFFPIFNFPERHVQKLETIFDLSVAPTYSCPQPLASTPTRHTET